MFIQYSYTCTVLQYSYTCLYSTVIHVQLYSTVIHVYASLGATILYIYCLEHLLGLLTENVLYGRRIKFIYFLWRALSSLKLFHVLDLLHLVLLFQGFLFNCFNLIFYAPRCIQIAIRLVIYRFPIFARLDSFIVSS